MGTVEDLAVERQIAAVEENAELQGWLFERVGPLCFRVSLSARNGDSFQMEVECDGFPVQPPAFHWRNPGTGHLDKLADSPAPYEVLLSDEPDMRAVESSRVEPRRASP